MITLVLLLLFTKCLLSTADSAAYLISGIADTTQLFRNSGSVDLIRHHLACFRHVYQTGFDSESCCSQLYLKGFIEKDQFKYCLDHLAMISSIDSFGSVAPAYYLALDSSVSLDSHHSNQMLLNGKRSYRQHRSLQVVEDNEKETLLDGYKGVDAFSPFHLTGFMSSGLGDDENTKISSFPLLGIAEGRLSNEGGMHRTFGQTVYLSFADLPDDNKSRFRMELNATVLLPITEDVFIDADDPLIEEYTNDSPDGVKCRARFISDGAYALKDECNIRFTSSEVIDIEQPSFASRQYVVAYHISASLDFGHSHKGTEGFELHIEYGTTLHIRYHSPILYQTGVSEGGLVPIVIQQPVLYSAIARVKCLPLDCLLERKYILETNATASELDAGKKFDIPQPVVIDVAAGVHDDYFWVTSITMSVAVIGGIVVIKSMDSISKWS